MRGSRNFSIRDRMDNEMIVLKWLFPVFLAALAVVHLISCWRGDDDLRKPTKVALVGLALASSGLILPFLFVYNPVLLLIDFSWPLFLLDFSIAAIGIFALSVSFMGIWRSAIPMWERVLFFAAGVALVNPVRDFRFAAIAAFCALTALHFALSRRRSSRG